MFLPLQNRPPFFVCDAFVCTPAVLKLRLLLTLQVSCSGPLAASVCRTAQALCAFSPPRRALLLFLHTRDTLDFARLEVLHSGALLMGYSTTMGCW